MFPTAHLECALRLGTLLEQENGSMLRPKPPGHGSRFEDQIAELEDVLIRGMDNIRGWDMSSNEQVVVGQEDVVRPQWDQVAITVTIIGSPPNGWISRWASQIKVLVSTATRIVSTKGGTCMGRFSRVYPMAGRFRSDKSRSTWPNSADTLPWRLPSVKTACEETLPKNAFR